MWPTHAKNNPKIPRTTAVIRAPNNLPVKGASLSMLNPSLSQVFRSRSGASERVTCDFNDQSGPRDLSGGFPPALQLRRAKKTANSKGAKALCCIVVAYAALGC